MAESGVIYLHKDGFDFFSILIGKIIQFRFVPEISKDLDVVNQELLENLISLFIANNKIVPTGIVVVIADNAAFMKDFLSHSTLTPSLGVPGSIKTANSQPEEEDLKQQIDFFIEHVPFDDVSSKTFPLINGIKVWATNKDLYESIINSFEKQKFDIKIVLPGIVFDGNISSKTSLDPIMANTILQSFNLLVEHNLLTKNPSEFHIKENSSNQSNEKVEEVVENIEINDKPDNKKSKKRLFLMLGVFGVLIIILVFMFITQKPLG